MKMIRGVNKRIIEITDTGSEYFERALMFVRPDSSDLPDSALEEEAMKLVSAMSRPPSEKRKRRHAKRRRLDYKAVVILVLGAALAAAIFFLCR